MRDRKVLISFAVGAIAAGCAALIALYISELTERPGFCGSCHEMGFAVRSWREGPHGPDFADGKGAVRASCGQCHLPRDPLLRFAVKGVKGIRNAALHLAGADVSRVKKAQARVYVSNCMRCHENLTAGGMSDAVKAVHRSILEGNEKPNCLECHRTVGHGASDPLR